MSSPALIRFRASMVMNFDKWHDGEPYDLSALDDLDPAERDPLVSELASKSTLDWRDVEALRRLATPAALARIADVAQAQHDDGGGEALVAEIEANGLTPDLEIRFIALLERAMVMAVSLDRLYALAEAHPTPAIRAQLFRNARIAGDEATRYSFGAFLLYLNGHSEDWYGFDASNRPHLLDLNSDDYKTYKAAVAWLQDKIDNPKTR